MQVTMTVNKTLQLKALSLMLNVISTAAITSALYTMMVLVSPTSTLDPPATIPDNSDDINETLVLLRMFNNPQPKSTAAPNPDKSQIPIHLMHSAHTILVVLLSALIMNLIGLGMITQSLCESPEVERTARPQWNPVTQRDKSLALQVPDSEDRTQGGVVAVRPETPPPGRNDGGDGRRDSGRDTGTLRRSQATTMLHLSSCSPDEARRSLNWRPLTELGGTRGNQDGEFLRRRPRNDQCGPRLREDSSSLRFP